SVAPEVGKPPTFCSVSRRTNWLWPRQICERRKQKSKRGFRRRAARGARASNRANRAGRGGAVVRQIGGDPAVDVRIRDRVGVAEADPDARRIVPEVEQGLEHLGPEGPVQVVSLSPFARHRDEREHLLLPGWEPVAEAADDLRG